MFSRKTNSFIPILISIFLSISLWATACSPVPITHEKPSDGQEQVAQKEQPKDESQQDASAPQDGGSQPEKTEPETSTPQDNSQPEKAPQPDKPNTVIPYPTTGWCARVTPGTPGKQKALLALSAAHAQIRFLGIHAGGPKIDTSLSTALGQHPYNDPKLLPAYAGNEPALCALPASETTMPSAKLQWKGEIAILQPGTGKIELPTKAKALIIDLRNLPNVPALEDILKKAIGLALPGTWSRSSQKVRSHQGMKDEHFNPNNVYKNIIKIENNPPFQGSGSKALPLAFIVGKRLPPIAAELAGSLRLTQRAWLIGESIPSAVAESVWKGIGKAGLAFRVKALQHNGTDWPDYVDADKKLSELDAFAKVLPTSKNIPPFQTFTPQRQLLKVLNDFRKYHSQQVTKANITAALLISHGALRAFYPYFKTVGDHIDTRLEEAIKQLETMPLTGINSRNLMRFFGESIKDGHCFVYSLPANREYQGYMLLQVDQIEGKIVVRRSGHSEIKVGDVIAELDGVPAADWLKKEYKRTSAATDGYRFDLATRELNTMKKAMALKITSPDGKSKTVQIAPQGYQAYTQFLKSAKERRAGFLKDLQAPDLYYVNLNGATIEKEDLQQLIKDMQKAKGLVLDMRGYPGSKVWTLVRHLVKSPMPTPIFGTYHWTAPNTKKMSTSYSAYPPLQPHISAPAVYIVGPRTVSAAEHLGTMLKQSKRVTFLGRRSAGTNGNITGVVLPGGLIFTFTGMEILWRDKKPFHGIGLVPEVKIAPSIQDIAKGKDSVLLKAIETLKKR